MLTLLLQQAVSNLVQIVGQDTETHVALVASEPFVRTAIQSMMFQAVDVRFDRVMPGTKRLKTAATLSLIFRPITSAAFGHDHLRNIQFQ